MEMERITIDLPIVKIEANSPIFSCDFAKEHYPTGLFIVDDGVMRHLMTYDGVYVNAIPCPHDVIEKHIIEKAVIDNDAIYHRDMEAIEDRLAQIARLVGETKDEVRKSENRLTDTLMDERARQVGEFNILRDGMEKVAKLSFTHKSDSGANVLDVAKAFAVISKPELIKELNK